MSWIPHPINPHWKIGYPGPSVKCRGGSQVSGQNGERKEDAFCLQGSPPGTAKFSCALRSVLRLWGQRPVAGITVVRLIQRNFTILFIALATVIY